MGSKGEAEKKGRIGKNDEENKKLMERGSRRKGTRGSIVAW